MVRPSIVNTISISRAAFQLSVRQENPVFGNFLTSATNLDNLGPTGWYASKTSFAPQIPSISASAIVAHLNLVMPASINNFVASGDLLVFMWGRNLLTSP